MIHEHELTFGQGAEQADVVYVSSAFIVMHCGTIQSWYTGCKTALSQFRSGIIHDKMTSQFFD